MHISVALRHFVLWEVCIASKNELSPNRSETMSTHNIIWRFAERLCCWFKCVITHTSYDEIAPVDN